MFINKIESRTRVLSEASITHLFRMQKTRKEYVWLIAPKIRYHRSCGSRDSNEIDKRGGLLFGNPLWWHNIREAIFVASFLDCKLIWNWNTIKEAGDIRHKRICIYMSVFGADSIPRSDKDKSFSCGRWGRASFFLITYDTFGTWRILNFVHVK